MFSKLSWVVVVVVFLGALGTGHTDDGRQTPSKAAPVAAQCHPEAQIKPERLKPWEPVDASFNGCSEGLCGKRGQNERAIAQPGAKVGDYTYCMVSGAVFQIKDSHLRAEVAGKTVYFCCEGCARYFAANRERVLSLRRPAL